MAPSIAPTRSRGRVALWQFVVLAGLVALVYRTELSSIVRRASLNLESAHLLAAPIVIAVLIWLRRNAIAESVGRGSMWGVVAIVIGLALNLFATWPFNYGYPQQASMTVAFAGAVLAAGGWRLLGRCLPMLLVLALSIPIGFRYYAFFVIKPETVTLQVVQAILELLPGLTIEARGPDLMFDRGGTVGSIGLGEQNRGVSMLFACLVTVAFVTFARIRPLWQIIVVGLAGIPIVLLVNLLRLLAWALIAIYGGASEVSNVPRAASVVISLVLAYAFTGLLLAILDRIIVVEEAAGDAAGDPET